MKKRIIEALKTKYKNLGFSDKAFDGVAAYLEPSIKEEADIETGIAGVEALLKVFQGEQDTIRTSKSAAEKKLKDLEDQIKALSGKKDPEPPTPPNGDDVPAWAKALIEANKALSEQVNRMNGENLAKQRKQQLNEVIKALPEKLRKPYERMSLESLKDEEFTTLLSEVTEDVAGIQAESAKRGAVFGRPVAKTGGAGGKGGEKEATDAEAQSVVDRLSL